ncbi:MAG: glycosyltransferase family 2 protein, partial [Candidatus Omnitrophica bacterium]|nr:glycosyltransferase family 2 protein [Candidatus Omnitrophota bacterium]
VIPVYNEAENINVVLRELFSVCKKIAGIDNLQVIVVDDHSPDGTFDIVNELNDSRITILRLSRRSGSHMALRAGIREAAGEVVLCISADGQDDPFCLGKMLDKWRSGSHVVWALRKDRKKEPWYVRIPAQLFYRLLFSFLKGEDNKIDLCRADFFLLDKKVIQSINACPERNTSLFGLIVWLGFMQGQVEYERRSRLSGRSKWDLRSLFSLAKDWVIAFQGFR